MEPRVGSLNPKQLASLLDVSEWVARNLIRRGEVRAAKIGGRWKIHVEDAIRYIEERTNDR